MALFACRSRFCFLQKLLWSAQSAFRQTMHLKVSKCNTVQYDVLSLHIVGPSNARVIDEHADERRNSPRLMSDRRHKKITEKVSIMVLYWHSVLALRYEYYPTTSRTTCQRTLHSPDLLSARERYDNSSTQVFAKDVIWPALI